MAPPTYGEWLRRDRRRVEARVQLRAAHDLLGALRMAAFAERARRELAATGETVRKRTVGTADARTTQGCPSPPWRETGGPTRRSGARLFLSARTVE